MSTQRWYELARLVSDHEGWEEERERLEALLRNCVEAAGEEYVAVVFAAWSRLPGGARLFLYQTCSPSVRESFHLAALADAVFTGRSDPQALIRGEHPQWICPGDTPAAEGS